MLSRLFARKKIAPAGPEQEPLVLVPIPPLVTLLVALRTQKGAELTEAEVLAARDGAVCVAMPLGVARQVAEKRGYDDIDPENAWIEWQAFLPGYLADDADRPRG